MENTLLVSIEGLGKDVIACEDHNDGKMFVNKSEDTMLEFARHNGLTVEIGDFFDL